MARGAMKAGSLAWKKRKLEVLAAQLSKMDDPEVELENFLMAQVEPNLRNDARNYFLELIRK